MTEPRYAVERLFRLVTAYSGKQGGFHSFWELPVEQSFETWMSWGAEP
mgnify:CR=1 FL=1